MSSSGKGNRTLTHRARKHRPLVRERYYWSSKVPLNLHTKSWSQIYNGDGHMKTYIPPTKSLVMFCLLLASVFMGSMTATALQIGEKAPEFTLSSTTGEKISLNQYKGKRHVLIQFYSMDFNPT